MTRKAAALRGFLIIAAAVLERAQTDPTFQKTLPPVVVSWIGLAAVGFITWRAFLDNSNARAKIDDPATPTTPVTTPAQDVSTT